MKKITISILFVFYTLFAQDGEWQHYFPEDNELPFPFKINIIKVDKLNNKWFGVSSWVTETEEFGGGLTKFDGETWTQYQTTNSNLSENTIKSIEFDFHNNVWIGMRDSGLAILKNDNISLVVGPLQFIERGQVKKILADKKGNIWVLYSWVKYPGGTFKPSALMKFDGNRWTNFNLDSIQVPEGEIYSIALDRFDNLFCGSQNKLLKYDGDNWIHIIGHGDDRRLKLSSLKFASDGVLWVGTSGTSGVSNLLLYENDIWENTSEIFLGGEPVEILFDDLGNTWVGGNTIIDKYLSFFNGNEWEYFNEKNSALLSGVLSLAMDSSGVLWCGTFRGTCTFKENRWEYYAASGGIPSTSVNKVIVDDENNKWFGTGLHGLAKYDGLVWEKFDKSNSGIPSNQIYDIEFDPANNVWVGTREGIGSFDGDNWTVYNHNNTNAPIGDVFDLEFDKQGKLWAINWTISFSDTLVSFDGNNWVVFHSDNSPFLENTVLIDLEIDNDNNLWLGTDNGFYIYDGSNWINFNKNNSILPNNFVQCFAFDTLGITWVGTNYGIVKITGDQWEVFTPQNSALSAGSFEDIVIDSKHNIWVGHSWSDGISKYDGTDWHNYNTSSLLNSTGITVTSISLDKYENLWISSPRELFEFNEDKIVSVDEKNNLIEENFEQKVSIYPNPFNASTNINFTILETSKVNIKVFSITGELMKIITNEVYNESNYIIPINLNDFATGIYFTKVTQTIISNFENEVFVKKIILLK